MQLSGPGTGAGAARLSRPRGPWVGERRAARTDLGQRQVAAERPCSRGDRAALGGAPGRQGEEGPGAGLHRAAGHLHARVGARPAAPGRARPLRAVLPAAGRALSARCACADRARTHQRPVEVGKQRTAGMHVRVFDAESLCLTHIRTCHDECSGRVCSGDITLLRASRPAKQNAQLRHPHARYRGWQRFGAQAPLAGEIVTYLVDEGDPVEYRQELVEMAPYFGALPALVMALSPLVARLLSVSSQSGKLPRVSSWCSWTYVPSLLPSRAFLLQLLPLHAQSVPSQTSVQAPGTAGAAKIPLFAEACI